MKQNDPPPWLVWAREIQALSQTGLAFSETDYDLQRYRRLGEIAAEIVERHTGCSKGPIVEGFLAQQGYATPKIDVRGAVLREGKILLVKEGADGKWCMPGGWADVGETPADAIAREVWEESGFTVRPNKVVGVYDANRDGTPREFYHAYKVVFLCALVGGQARPSSETLAVDFFDFNELPPLSTERTHQRHLAEVRAHRDEPNRPAAFE
jgi:ADP-ribose pyrophosphatase YjhB (NUDIX family)